MEDYPGDEVFDKIEALCEKGEGYMDREKYRSALSQFWKAYNLLPEPKAQYPSGTYLLVSIGDIYFMAGKYEEAVEQLSKAKAYPEGMGNPFLHFRLAQSYFELNQKEAAFEEFKLAFEVDGAAVFEDEEAKYWAFFEEKNAKSDD